MTNPQADQLKPLLQRLLTMAESHDERLARLEAAHSRLGTQIARVGDQLSRQADQLSRLEDAPVPAPAAAPAPAPLATRTSGAAESGVNNRFGEQFGRLNEQITRVREQFGRMTEQLSRIERAQTELRDDATQHGSEQQRLLERLEVTLIRRQDELAAELPERIQDRMEQVLGFVIEGGEEEPVPQPATEPPATHAAPPAPAPAPAPTPVPAPTHLVTVQEEVRQLGNRIVELMAHIGKLGEVQPAPAAVAAPAPVPPPAPVAAVAPTPQAPTPTTPPTPTLPIPAPVATATPGTKPVVARPVVVRVVPGNRQASR